MSSLSFLVTELQALASETRRKHPDVREAAEKSLTILRASPEQSTSLATDGPQSEELLRPVFMGCATKNAKVVVISLGSLQRLISLRAVPQSAVPHIVSIMSGAMSQGVDIQLRILQTLVSLIPNFPHIHGELLADALLLCFKLQESRIAVVSSTAAATLRQLVMFVVDKMVSEDQLEDLDPTLLTEIHLPDESVKYLGPSAHDTFAIFEDLCLLANGEKPNFLHLEFLHKTFALELIESVLANYFEAFRRHTELILLLQRHLCPLLLKSLSDRPLFPLILRCTRVIFLLVKQFSPELKTEVEVFLMHLIKTVSDDGDAESSHPPRPSWMRVLAMEIMRGLCSDAELMRNIWMCYDGQGSQSNVSGSLITALKRLITEKPALLGVSQYMFGVGVPHDSATSLSLDGVAGRVATVASATVSGVVGMMHSTAGLSIQGSAMKLQCIDQLDKADAPPIPEAYVYLLALQCLVSLCEGFVAFAGPLYTAFVVQKPRMPGDAAIRAPPALDITALSPDEYSTTHLLIVRDIIESGWPALLAALSFIVATNLSDELFADVLGSYQAMTNVSGMLGLVIPRDAFLNSLAKYAVPTRVVSSLETYVEPQTPRSATVQLTDSVGLTSPMQAPGLSERNVACLKVFVSTALFLAGSLGESWFGILEVLQNANYVLTYRSGHQSTPSKKGILHPIPSGGGNSVARSSSNISGTPAVSRHPLLADLDPDSMLGGIQRLFDASKNLEDSAFKDFVNALCRLSGEMVGMQTAGLSGFESEESLEEKAQLSPITKGEAINRRRISGIHIPRTLRMGDFGISKLGEISMLNIHRLIYRSPDIAWNKITTYLLSVIHFPLASQPIRVQATRVLNEILFSIPRSMSLATGEVQVQVQNRVLGVLAQQVVPDVIPPASDSSTAVELRRMGLETLHQILESSVYSLVTGWETIFHILESVCRPVPPPPPSPSADPISPGMALSPETPSKPFVLGMSPRGRNHTNLVKIAFQSMTLVCDSISTLSPEHLRLCIRTLGQFGRQADTNIALTAATSLLWSVSDAIQAKRKDAELEPEYSELWMFLLFELLKLGTDPRPEVRDGAIQTLFRTIQLYGSTLSLETWDECVWKVSFPLLESLIEEIKRHRIQLGDDDAEEVEKEEGGGGGGGGGDSSGFTEKAWNESQILALTSLGSIFQDFLESAVIELDSFVEAWDRFVGHVENVVLHDHPVVSAPALRSLEKGIKAVMVKEEEEEEEVKKKVLKVEKVQEMLRRTWEAVVVIGDCIITNQPASVVVVVSGRAFTQESLVAFVDLIQSTRRASRGLMGMEWGLEQLTQLAAIVKGVLTYAGSVDYRPDIDNLTPVQSVVLETLSSIDLSVPGSASLVMRDLSEYATLPFIAAFDVKKKKKKGAYPEMQKRVTYIGISKKTMPMLVELLMRFHQCCPEIYVDGTLEAVFGAYAIPMKMKYECPVSSKLGKDLPLWKTATRCFLECVALAVPNLKQMDRVMTHDRLARIWRRVLDCFKGAILADCSTALTFPLDVQAEEEEFDFALLEALRKHVVPCIGAVGVPDVLVSEMARILCRGSYVVGFAGDDDEERWASTKVGRVESEERWASTKVGRVVPRERFSYWCFDLLFLICSRREDDDNKRLAVLSMPELLSRCRMVLQGYVVDESVRGRLPFSRARENELLYVLKKLKSMRVWPGTLWAALSNDPSNYVNEQPSVDSVGVGEILSDVVKRSSVGVLFYFYGWLCEIVAIPRQLPSAWNVVGSDGDGDGDDDSRVRVEMDDARRLAKDCLRVVGREMGVVMD